MVIDRNVRGEGFVRRGREGGREGGRRYGTLRCCGVVVLRCVCFGGVGRLEV
jgi:hypothetical protein